MQLTAETDLILSEYSGLGIRSFEFECIDIETLKQTGWLL